MRSARPWFGRRAGGRSPSAGAAAAPPELARLLGAAGRRLRRLQVAASLPRAAAALLAGAALAPPLWQLRLEPLALLAPVLGAVLAARLLLPALIAPGAVAVAHRLDRANGLSDLLASALTVEASGPGMVTELRRRAGARAAGIAPRSVGGWRLDRGGVIGLGLALVLSGVAAAAVIERERAPGAPGAVAAQAGEIQATPQADALRAARAELADALDPAADARTAGLAELAQAFASDPATRDAGRAMASGDAAAAAAELGQLAQRLSRMTPDERASLQSTLESGHADMAADPLVAGPLQAAAEALAEHRLASAATALEELGAALQGAQAQLADQAELRDRMEQLDEQLGGGPAPAPPAAESPGSPTAAAADSARTGSVERIRSDGTIELVPLSPESNPAALEPRPLELGIETEPGRNPSAGLLGFARTAPAAPAPVGFADEQLLRSYVLAAGDE